MVIGEGALRDRLLRFLAAHEDPARWTFFQGCGGGCGLVLRAGAPDIVLDVGGRIAYVAVKRQGGGRLDSVRAAWQGAARKRGAPCFVVRSLPEMEQALRSLGVACGCRGRIAADLARRRGRVRG